METNKKTKDFELTNIDADIDIKQRISKNQKELPVENLGQFMDAIRQLLKPGLVEVSETKRPIIYKNQYTLKIPKDFALKSNINKDSYFEFVFNPLEEETINKIKKSKFVIYLVNKEEKKDEGEKEKNNT